MADLEAKIGEVFTKMDADGSGSITQAEMDGVFKVFDADGSGTVTKDEFVTVWIKHFDGTEEGGGKVFAKLDKDSSGDISMSEISDLFKLMDSDGSGDVSKSEFVAVWKNLMT